MARGRGNWERDTGSGPGSGSGQPCRSPYLDLISEWGVARDGSSWERDIGRLLGSGSDKLRPNSEALRGDPVPGKQGIGGQAVTHPAEPPGLADGPRRSGEQSALQVSGQDPGSLRGGALDRGNGGPADSWTSQPGRPATRDYRRLDRDCSCPHRAAQPGLLGVTPSV